MPETPPSVLDRFLGSDVTMYTGPGEIPQAYANKMLLAALQEAQSVVRSYDTKAQIVGVGYILALNLILHFGDLLPTPARLGPLFFVAVWGFVILATCSTRAGRAQRRSFSRRPPVIPNSASTMSIPIRFQV
jgi:hypothetical protein